MDVTTISGYLTEYGGIAIFVIVLLEYLNLPGFPAGMFAAKGNIHFLQVLCITILAGLTGSLLLYALGRAGGEVFLRTWYQKFPKQRETIEKNLNWIRNKGCIAVFLAKLIPMIRTIVSIPAGVLKLNLTKYIISSASGIAIWNLVLVGAGYIAGGAL